MPMYSIEYAKSGRSSCPGCKRKIAKGEMRMCVSSEGSGDYNIVKYHHVGCFKLPRKLKHMSVEEFLIDEVTDNSDDISILEDEGKRTEVIRLIEAAAANITKKKKAGKADADSTIMGMIKKAASDAADGPKKKKQKTEDGGSDTDFDSLVKEYNAIMATKPNVDTLKDFLRWNRQFLTGTKDFVFFKVLDGIVNGRLGTCLLCGGRLKMQEDMENVCCHGVFDEVSQVKIPCSFKDHRLSERLPRDHFFTEEPTEEEMEEMKAEKGSGAAVNPMAQELLNEATELKWTLDNNQAISAAADKVAKLVQGKVALPDKVAKKEIGQILLPNKDKSPQEIVQLVIDKFGFAEDRIVKNETKEAAMKNACNNPKNGAILSVFQELAQYYFKDGNGNAGASYTKVSNAIKDLAVEITADNAMSFSKGKNKVPGIGGTSAKYMKIFKGKGSFEKLELKREIHIPGYAVPAEWEDAVEKLRNK